MTFLRYRLWRERRAASPDRAFKRALLRRLSGAPARAPAWRVAAVGMAVVALFLGGGTGAYAYVSPEVVDGHPLYFARRAIERAEERLAVTPGARAEFHARMMERRLSEAERLSELGADREETAIRSAAEELDRAVEAIGNDRGVESERERMAERLGKQRERYERAVKRVSEGNGMRRPLPPPEFIRERLETIRVKHP